MLHWLNLIFLAAKPLTGDQQGSDNVLAWSVTLVPGRLCSKHCDGTQSVPCCLIKLGGSIQLYCYEFRSARRAIGHVTRIATSSPTGTDNSVVTLLELPPRCQSWEGVQPHHNPVRILPARNRVNRRMSIYLSTRVGSVPRSCTTPQVGSGHEPLKRLVPC